MKRLWLTYAWKDNVGNNVDFVIQELQRQGLDVRFDRAELVAGQRLWEQIDRAIREGCDGWAIYVTEASLNSQPCQEEIAYALDRTLREGPENFPLIGIFPSKIDRSIVPSALATRLYVDLKDSTWPKRVASGLQGTAGFQPPGSVPRFVAELHHRPGADPIIEMRPRAGTWLPFFMGTPKGEERNIVSVWYGPPERPDYRPMMLGSGTIGDGVEFEGQPIAGKILHHEISPSTSAYAMLKPGRFYFGEARDGEVHSFDLSMEFPFGGLKFA